MSKHEIRKRILAKRESLTLQQIQVKSKSIETKLFALAEYRQAGTVMAYVDFRGEVQTGGILTHILAQNKRLFLPVTDVPGKKLLPAEVVNLTDDLAAGTWGITEPKAHCRPLAKPEEIDLVIIPGVAFDTLGNRLGYGKGFYDRFLPNLKENAVLVALAFEEQITDNIYPEDDDVPVHLLITELSIWDFRKKS